jgi:hypothetical protein
MGIYDNGETVKKLKHYIVFHTRSCVPAVRGWGHKKMAYKEDTGELCCVSRIVYLPLAGEYKCIQLIKIK